MMAPKYDSVAADDLVAAADDDDAVDDSVDCIKIK